MSPKTFNLLMVGITLVGLGVPYFVVRRFLSDKGRNWFDRFFYGYYLPGWPILWGLLMIFGNESLPFIGHGRHGLMSPQDKIILGMILVGVGIYGIYQVRRFARTLPSTNQAGEGERKASPPRRRKVKDKRRGKRKG
jgi:hypothetical protein